jgi:hypothetical protein
MKDDTAKFSQAIPGPQTLVDEIHQLRQQNDILTNQLAFLNELVQQLTDEIAVLKGRQPRPQFPSSKLESKKTPTNLVALILMLMIQMTFS